MNYEPEKYSKKLNPHVKSHILWYCFVTMCLSVVAGMLFVHFGALSPKDPTLMSRIVSIATIKGSLALAVAFGGPLFVDWRWNGNLFKGIINGNMACALYACVLFFGPIYLLS